MTVPQYKLCCVAINKLKIKKIDKTENMNKIFNDKKYTSARSAEFNGLPKTKNIKTICLEITDIQSKCQLN